MDIMDTVADLADLGPRIVLIAAVFIAFNVIAFAICHVLGTIIDNSGLLCLLVFVVCNVKAIYIVKALND